MGNEMSEPEGQKEVLLHLATHMGKDLGWSEDKDLHMFRRVKVDDDGFVCELDLSRTQLRIDLSLMEPLLSPRLKKLLLHQNAELTGDIALLARCTGLRSCKLNETQVSGDIVVFEQTPDLVECVVAQTMVTGDISAFTTLDKLQDVFASGTEVHGDLKCFEGHSSLVTLACASSQVQGSIEVLADLPKLTRIGLSSTKVTGNVNVFEVHPSIKEVFVHNTEVTGDFARFREALGDQLTKLATPDAIAGELGDLPNAPPRSSKHDRCC